MISILSKAATWSPEQPFGEAFSRVFSSRLCSAQLIWTAVTSNSGGKAHRVKQKGENAWRLYDMLGNVWEWVADWYKSDYYQTSETPAIDPKGPISGDGRVWRGGAWNDNPEYLRASNRGWVEPGYRDVDMGFRCAREVIVP